VNPDGNCVGEIKLVSCDLQFEESLFEDALRRMSMDALRAIVKCGIYEVDSFLNVDEDQLRAVPGMSSEVIEELVAARNEVLKKTRSYGHVPRPLRAQISHETQHDLGAQSNKCEQNAYSAGGAEASGLREPAEDDTCLTGTVRDRCSPNHAEGVGDCLGNHRAIPPDSSVQPDLGAALGEGLLIAETEPIPEELLSELSIRAYNVVVRNRITQVAHLLALSEAELRSFRNAGEKTVRELMQLQDKLRECLTPESRHRDSAATARGSGSARVKPLLRRPSLWEPEEWSLLRRPLRVVCGSCRHRLPVELGSRLVRDLSLSSNDLEALRSIAVFMDDSLDDVQSLSFGILADSGISDNGLCSLFTGLCDRFESRYGCRCLEAVTATPIVQSSDVEGLPRAWIQAFGVPSRVGDLLNAFGILTFQDSLGISERDVIERLGFRVESLRLMSRLWMLRGYSRIAVRKMRHWGRSIGESLERILDDFLWSLARNHRERRIIEGRLGLFGGRQQTLEELGVAEGLSRQRVSQIATRLMRRIGHYRSHTILEPIWNAIEHVLRRSGGACTTSELCSLLAQCFGWASTPSEHEVEAIGGIWKDLRIIKSDDQSVISLHDSYPCLRCDLAQRWVVELTDQANGVISALEVAERLSRRCPSSCTLRSSQDRGFSQGYALVLASQTDGLRVEGSTILSSSAWKLKFGSAVEAIEVALLDAGRAIHFTELARTLWMSGRDVSDQYVHACLSSKPDVALMWGKGEYIHRKYVQLPLRLIDSIEVTASQRLRSGIPLLSVSGLFDEYRAQLEREGIPTDRALYSCLRVSSNSQLAYPRYPYISLAESSTTRPTVPSILEEFVREHEEGVPLDDVEDYLVSVLGVSEQLRNNYITALPNVVQINDRLVMHLDHLSVDAARFREIEDYVDEVLADAESVSVDKIFNGRLVTCKLMGISTPTMLYSLLRTFCSDKYALPRYPTIARDGTEAQGGVSGSVVRYLREANAPVSLEQLTEYFVEGRGFRERSIYSAKYYEGIVQYAPGTVVHVDALEWTSEKQERLEMLALVHLHEQSLRGKPFGRLDLVVESVDLPRLPSHAPWTPVLLGELLCLKGKFRIIGTKRHSFVQIPNDYGIENLQDLVCWLLVREFDGAARLKEFAAYLRDEGVLQKTLTQSMLGDGSRVVIEGDAVMITDYRLPCQYTD